MLEEVSYLVFLLGHITFGAMYLDHVHISQRRVVCTVIGLSTSLILSRWDLLHQLALTFLIIACVYIHRKTKAFNIWYVLNAVAFGYLLFFRFVCINNFSNMIMMMLVLRMGGLGSEFEETTKQEFGTIKGAPLTDIFHYAFSYMGLLAGPYIRYRTYSDFVNGDCATVFCQRRQLLEKKLIVIPVFVAMLLLSNQLAPVDAAKTEEFHEEHGFLYTFWYMIMMFVGFRARLYTGFILAECGCIAGGLGAYPHEWGNKSGQGPSTRDKPKCPSHNDFYTVQNLNIWECEAAPTVKRTMRAWNQTVQYWLAVNCHKKLPFSTSVRMACTLAVSAFWHGVRPGYYLCLISTVFFVCAEDYLLDYFIENPLFPMPTTTLGLLAFAQLKLLVFAYLGVAFVMMTLPEIIRFYWNLSFIGHVIVAAIIIYFKFIAKRPPRRRIESKPVESKSAMSLKFTVN